MSSAAEFIGAHAVPVLCVFAVAVLLATFLCWHAVLKYGDLVWRAASRVWNGIARSSFGARARGSPLLRAGFNRTLSVWRYLGIHAAISFAVALAALGLFFELADEIDAAEDLGRFDDRLAASLLVHVDAATLEVFSRITQLGDRNFLVALGAAVAVYLLWKRWWLHLAVWVIATGVGGLLMRLLKTLFERTRPIHEHALTDSSGWSFPSGHASGAALVYGMLGYLMVRHTPHAWHIPVALLTVTLVVFVGFSRVILNVHYLSDVLAGFAAAAAWLALSIAAFETLRRRGRNAAEYTAESVSPASPP